jgi:hypothetical protein
MFEEHALFLRQEVELIWNNCFPAIGIDYHLLVRGKSGGGKS